MDEKTKKGQSPIKNLAKEISKKTAGEIYNRLTKVEGIAVTGARRAVLEAIKKSLE